MNNEAVWLGFGEVSIEHLFFATDGSLMSMCGKVRRPENPSPGARHCRLCERSASWFEVKR